MRLRLASLNPWPFAIMGFFACFAAATVGLIILATSQPEDLVSTDYYGDELKYQSRLDSLNRTAALGASVAVAYDTAQRAITVRLPPDQAHRHPTGRIRLYRPSASQLDREVPLALSLAGCQIVPTGELAAGLWKVRVAWTVAGLDYFWDQRLVVPGHRP